MAVAVAGLAVVVVFKLPMEMWQIFWNPEGGAKDLRYFFDWTRDWAGGGNVYLPPAGPAYPPGSLPILYALGGWLDWSQARLLMGVLSLCAAALLFGIAWRATGPLSSSLLETSLIRRNGSSASSSSCKRSSGR